jgi:PX domain
LALKAQKLVELMMVSGIPTASGYEERIRFAEIEVVDRGANEKGLVANAPQGQEIHGWDVNVAGVRTTSVKRHVRYHQHAEYLIRVKQPGRPEIYVGRRYEDFKRMHKRLRLEFPGKILPPLPKKNLSDQSYSLYADDSVSESSVSTQNTEALDPYENSNLGGLRSYLPFSGSANNTNGHRRNLSAVSAGSVSRSPRPRSPRPSGESHRPITLYRETQRVSLRAALRNMLQNEQVAQSTTMREFLTTNPIKLNEEEMMDTERRKDMDERRIEEQRQFYEIARKRAAELDVHMEKFRRDVVERSKF